MRVAAANFGYPLRRGLFGQSLWELAQMLGIRGDAAVELCQRVIDAFRQVIPEGVNLEVKPNTKGLTILSQGPEGSGVVAVPGFGTPLPLPESVQMRLALTQILAALRDEVCNATQTQWPPGGKYKARVTVSGRTARLSYAMADGSVLDVGTIAV